MTLALDTLNALERRAKARLNIPAKPPGPPSSLMPLHIRHLMQDQIQFMQNLQHTHGDCVYFRLGRLKFYLIHDPELLQQVLLEHNSVMIKDPFARDLKELLGNGLLLNEGNSWRQHRKLAAPKLKRTQIASYAERMASAAHHTTNTIKAHQPFDLWQEMMDLTLHIVVETLFGLTYHPQAKDVGHAIEVAMEHYDAEKNSLWYFIPRQVPSLKRARFHEAKKDLDRIIRDMIKERSKLPPGDDLLWKLIEATHQNGHHLDETQLRDEALTMFLAGHETTALAITYAFDALARNPTIEEKLHKELAALPEDQPLGLESLAHLPYTQAIFKETLRLYPPAWILGRQAIQDVQLGPWHVPKDSILVSSPYIMHRKPEIFDDPLTFKPERWLDENFEKNIPRHGYLPFGGGPRICIGNHFASMEAILVIATLAKSWRFTLNDPSPLQFDPFITLRPTKPVMVTPVPR